MARLTQITSREQSAAGAVAQAGSTTGGVPQARRRSCSKASICAQPGRRAAGAGAAGHRQRGGLGEPALARAGARRAADSRRRRRGDGRLGTLDSPASIAFLVPCRRAADRCRARRRVVLDRIQDPGNVGAILRSAAAFGFAQVIALVGTAALWAPKVVRAGMGAHFGLRLIEGAEPEALERACRADVRHQLARRARSHAFALPWPCAWVFGHEGQGISATCRARCRAMLRIAQPGGEESLNVAAAAAICLYESARRRVVTDARPPVQHRSCGLSIRHRSVRQQAGGLTGSPASNLRSRRCDS